MIKDSTLKAMVQLLDDEDTNVFSHIESEFIKFGETITPKLKEVVKYFDDKLIQDRVKLIVNKINCIPIKEILKKDNIDSDDIFDMWLRVSMICDPTLEYDYLKNTIIPSMKDLFKTIGASHQNSDEKLLAVQKAIYSVFEFDGSHSINKEDDVEYSNYYLLSYLFKTKVNNTISMALLYSALSKYAGLEVQAVNYAGYYAIRYCTRGQYFCVDTYNKGMIFTQEQVVTFLDKMKVDNNFMKYQTMTMKENFMNMLKALYVTLQHEQREDDAEIINTLLID